MIRVFLLFFALPIISIIGGILLVLVGFFNPYNKFNDWVVKIWSKINLLIVGARVQVTGMENVDFDKPHIFMANHQSHVDIPVLTWKIPSTPRMIAKKELFRVPFFGIGIKYAGYISIDRSNKAKAMESIQKAKQTLQKGVSVLLFPEGTRSETGEIGKFKRGGFILALQLGLPIVPISIYGTRQILPKHTLKIKSGVVKIHFGSPIDPKEYGVEKREELLERVKTIIIKNFNRLKCE